MPQNHHLRFGPPPRSDLNGAGDEAESVMEAVILLAHRAAWLGEDGKVIYDLSGVEDRDGFEVPPMRVIVSVERI